MKFASCDDDPGNSVNAYLWGGVQGVVALSLLFAPIFLRRTHVKIRTRIFCSGKNKTFKKLNSGIAFRKILSRTWKQF
ncbi:hypothetical protein [Leptospira noguchii]|uniref:Uncharacterized protein n=1 Tax=Leptospira noguchii TaxID=28182 RepID=A0AAE9GG60_9LEPT|nr:hypothetical protein [Leptospira noguchii]UOG55868.1 hypothetical protein MAL03_13505 [Leptospira noguchii]